MTQQENSTMQDEVVATQRNLERQEKHNNQEPENTNASQNSKENFESSPSISNYNNDIKIHHSSPPQKKRRLNPSVSFNLESNSVHTYSKSIPILSNDSFCAKCLNAFSLIDDTTCVECNSCSFYFHVPCAGLKLLEIISLPIYICDQCAVERKQIQLYALKDCIDYISDFDYDGKFTKEVDNLMNDIDYYIGKPVLEWIEDTATKLSGIKKDLKKDLEDLIPKSSELTIVEQRDAASTLSEMRQKYPEQFERIIQQLVEQESLQRLSSLYDDDEEGEYYGEDVEVIGEEILLREVEGEFGQELARRFGVDLSEIIETSDSDEEEQNKNE